MTRSTDTSYEIQWKRIFAEGGAIVVSILLAFSIDAWWERRVATNQLNDYLVAIEGELVANEAYIDIRISRTFEQVLAAGRVLDALADSESDLNSEDFLHDLGFSILFSAGMEGRQNSIEALLNSDIYATISDVQLIAAISDYTWRSVALNDHVDLELLTYNEVLLPVLRGNVDTSNLGWTFYDSAVGPDGQTYRLTPESPFENVESHIRSLDFWNAIFNLLALLNDRYSIFLTVEESRAELLALVRAEIASLN